MSDIPQTSIPDLSNLPSDIGNLAKIPNLTDVAKVGNLGNVSPIGNPESLAQQYAQAIEQAGSNNNLSQKDANLIADAFGSGFTAAFGDGYVDTNTAINKWLNDPNHTRPDSNPPAPVQPYQCRIGAATFYVPPISISVNQNFEAGSLTGAAIRQISSPKFNSGHSSTSITMNLYFPNVDQIWGYSGDSIKLDFDKAPDAEVDTFCSSLRGLIAQFRYTPFLPVVNQYLNEVWNITAVGMRGLTIQTVPGFPFVLMAQLEMVQFNHKIFMPMVATLDDAIDWGRFRQYVGRAAIKLDASAKQAFVLNSPQTYHNGVVYPVQSIVTPSNPQTANPNNTNPNDVNGTASVFSSTKNTEFANGSNIDFYYPDHDPAQYLVPGAYAFSNSPSQNAIALDQGTWAQALSELSLNTGNGIVTINNTTLTQIENYAADPSLKGEIQLALTYVKQLGSISSQVFNADNLNTFKQAELKRMGITSSSTGNQQLVANQQIEGAWYAALYQSIIGNNSTIQTILALQDYLTGTVEIDEWDVPMTKLNVDYSKVIINSVEVSLGNNLARLQLNMIDQPAWQHIGGLDTTVVADMTVFGEDQLTAFRTMYDTINGLSRLEHGHAVLGFLGIKNVITALVGTRYVIPKSFSAETMTGFPHVYNVRMEFLDFDVFQQKRESLSDAQESQFITLMSKRNPFLRLQQVWSAFSAYSDFPLAITDSNGAIAGHLDPDFYFKSFTTIDDDIVNGYSKPPGYASETGSQKTATNTQFLQELGSGNLKASIPNIVGQEGASLNSHYPIVHHFGPITTDGSHASIGVSAFGMDLREGSTAVAQGVQINEAHGGNTRNAPFVKDGNYKATPPNQTVLPNFELTGGNTNSGTSVGNFAGMLQDLQYRDNSGRMIRAFPTYMLWLIDEGGLFAGITLFDNFYGLQSVLDFSIVSNQDVMGDTLILRLSNLSSRLSTNYSDQVNPSIFPGAATLINNNITTTQNLASGLDPNALINISSIKLEPGVRLHLRCGYCVDDQTEILTQNGWKTYLEIQPGELCLTLNHANGMSEWQSIQEVNLYPVENEEMYLIEGLKHSSLTTSKHRWPVLHRSNTSIKLPDGRVSSRQQPLTREWKTSETLYSNDKLICAAQNLDLPVEPKYTDAFVELVAWFWTEGAYGGQFCVDGVTYKNRCNISQSRVANPENCERIKRALTVLYGPASESLGTGGRHVTDLPKWKIRERPNRDENVYSLNKAASMPLREIVSNPDKVVSLDFIKSLTMAQLELFVHISFLADRNSQTGYTTGTIRQSVSERLDCMELAAILLGHRTHRYLNYVTADHIDYDYALYISSDINLAFTEKTTRPQKTLYTGMTWCPTTPNGTWMARRNGHAYFTGNSADPNLLETIFNGVVTEVESGDIVTITCQSDAIELGAVVNSTNTSGTTGAIDGSLSNGFYLSEPRDLIVRLLSMGASTFKDAISYATRGMIYSQNKFGIRHFGSILYDTMTQRESNLGGTFGGVLGSITGDVTNWIASGAEDAIAGVVSPQIAQLAQQLWVNLNSQRDYEVFKRNVYPGNGTGVSQYMGGDIGDGGINTAFQPPGITTGGQTPVAGPSLPEQLAAAAAVTSQTVGAGSAPSITNTYNVSLPGSNSYQNTANAAGTISSIVGGIGSNPANPSGSGAFGAISNDLHPIWKALGLEPEVTDDVPGTTVPILGTYGPYAEVSFRAETYQQTVWDLFKTCAALLPNYIVAVRPFMERSTVFYGKPHWAYTSGVIPLTYGANPATGPATSAINNSSQTIINKIEGLMSTANDKNQQDIYTQISNLSQAAISPAAAAAAAAAAGTNPGGSAATIGGDPNGVFVNLAGDIKNLPLTTTNGAVIPQRSGPTCIEMHLPTSPDLQTDINQHIQLPALPAGERHPYYMAHAKNAEPGQDTTLPGVPGAFGILDPASEQYYMNMRWPTNGPYPDAWRGSKILVFNPATNLGCICTPGDWGPGSQTGRVSGISPDTWWVLGQPAANSVLWYGFVSSSTPLGEVSWQIGDTFNNVQLPVSIAAATGLPKDLSGLNATGATNNLSVLNGTNLSSLPTATQISSAGSANLSGLSNLTSISGTAVSGTTSTDTAQTTFGASPNASNTQGGPTPTAVTALSSQDLMSLAKNVYGDYRTSSQATDILKQFTNGENGNGSFADAPETKAIYDKLYPNQGALYTEVVDSFVKWMSTNAYNVGWLVLTADVATTNLNNVAQTVSDIVDPLSPFFGFTSGLLESTGLAKTTVGSIALDVSNVLTNPVGSAVGAVTSVWDSITGASVNKPGWDFQRARELFGIYITYGAGSDTGNSADSHNATGGAIEWMISNATPGFSSDSVLGQSMESVGQTTWNTIYSAYNDIKTVVNVVLSGITDVMRLATTLLNQGISMSGFSGKQANLLNAVFNDSYYYDPALGVGSILWQADNCLAGETEVITYDGVYPIRELSGTEPILLTSEGWLQAPIKSFGKQELYEIVVSRGGVERTIKATADHGWYVDVSKRGGGQNSIERKTKDLLKGNRLTYAAAPISYDKSQMNIEFIKRGIVFGDGSLVSLNTSKVSLFGEKAELVKYFDDTHSKTPINISIGGIKVSRIPFPGKELPFIKETNNNLFSWLSGYMATDGCVSKNGNVSLNSSIRKNIEFVELICLRLGITTYGISEQKNTKGSYGEKENYSYSIDLAKKDLCEEFFLRTTHKERYLQHKRYNPKLRYQIRSVRKLNEIEEVFCAQVPTLHNFVLAGNILSRNCFTREYGEPVIEIRQPFQRVHYLNSFQHIMSNGITETMNDVYTVVTATSNGKSPHTVYFDKGAPTERQYEKMIDTGLYFDSPTWYNWELHPSEVIRDFIKHVNNSDDATEAVRCARNAVAQSLKGIYTGELMIIGDPSIRPFDMVYIADTYEKIYGLAEVQQVVHHFTPETGFITAVTPAAVVSVNDPERWEWGSLTQRQLAIQDMRNTLRHQIGITNSAEAYTGAQLDPNQILNSVQSNVAGTTQFSGGASAIVKDVAGSGALGSVIGGLMSIPGVGGVAAYLGWKVFGWVRSNFLDAHACFPPGTQVLVSGHNYKAIEKIEVGDSVFTHAGNWEQVTNVMERDISENLYEIKLDRFSGSNLAPTSEHPFLVFNEKSVKKYKDQIRPQFELDNLVPEWTTAANLRVGDYLVIQPNDQNIIEDIPIFDLSRYASNQYSVTEDKIYTKPIKGKWINRYVHVTPELMQVVGRYLGDGSIIHGNGKVYGFKIVFHEDEIRELENIRSIVHEQCGILATARYQSSDSKVIELQFGSGLLGQWIKENFSCGFANKSLPDWAYKLPEKHTDQLLMGLFGADGTIAHNFGTTSDRLKLNLSNKQLIFNIYTLLRNRDMAPCIFGGKVQGKKTIKGKVTQGTTPSYELVIPADNLPVIADAMGAVIRSTNQRRGYIRSGEYLAYRIKSIEQQPYIGKVYNLSVANDESYVAEGIVSHNCYIQYLNRNGQPMDSGLSYNQGVAVGQVHVWEGLSDALGIQIPYSIDGQAQITTTNLLSNLGWNSTTSAGLGTSIDMWTQQTRAQVLQLANTQPETTAPSNKVAVAEATVVGVIDPITLQIRISNYVQGKGPYLGTLRLAYLIDPGTINASQQALALINPTIAGAAAMDYLSQIFANPRPVAIRIDPSKPTDPSNSSALIGSLFYLDDSPSSTIAGGIGTASAKTIQAQLDANAGGYPEIGWQDYDGSGNPYTLNWELITKGYATVDTSALENGFSKTTTNLSANNGSGFSG